MGTIITPFLLKSKSHKNGFFIEGKDSRTIWGKTRTYSINGNTCCHFLQKRKEQVPVGTIRPRSGLEIEEEE